MLRTFLIYLSKAEWMRRLMMKFRLARRVALRFVAGESLEDALDAVRILNQKGMVATLDQLGEDTFTPEEARKTAEDIIEILNGIEKAGVRSGVSLKPTQIGLGLSEEICQENLLLILEKAKELDNFVRIDIEDSPTIDATLRVCFSARKAGYDNVGIALQSYLYRTDQDLEKLLAENTRIRMVKGAYKEPPEVAYPKKQDVDASFDRLTAMMIDHGLQDSSPAISEDGRFPPVTAVASHDRLRVDFAKAYAAEVNLPKEKLEFQMLYGIARDLQESLTAEGYPVRIYVPFGNQWYPYFMRRLAERPANLWFFLSSLFRK